MINWRLPQFLSDGARHEEAPRKLFISSYHITVLVNDTLKRQSIMASSPTDQVSEVFEKAKADFLNGIKDQNLRSQLQNATTIDDIWDYTEQLQKDQASSKRLRGMKKIEPYIERLKEYAGVIEVFLQVKPDVLALIWGPIKLLLQVSSNLVASFDAILGIMKNMGTILPRFNEFMPLYKNNERMKYVLGLFFQDILDFYLVSLRFFGLNRMEMTSQ